MSVKTRLKQPNRPGRDIRPGTRQWWYGGEVQSHNGKLAISFYRSPGRSMGAVFRRKVRPLRPSDQQLAKAATITILEAHNRRITEHAGRVKLDPAYRRSLSKFGSLGSAVARIVEHHKELEFGASDVCV